MSRRGRQGALWTCPKCGAKFVNRNQWHSCGLATLDDWLEPLGPRGRALFRHFEQLIAACGEYHVAPAKTRIAFLGHARFAGITKLSDRAMTCSFVLPYRLRSPRFVDVREVVPGWIVHSLRVTDPAELDDEVGDWIRAGYRLMGMRERLERKGRRARRR